MKDLKSPLFEKYENDKLENLSFVTGGAWAKSFDRNGNYVDNNDDSSNKSNGDITKEDTTGATSHNPNGDGGGTSTSRDGESSNGFN